MPTIIYPVSIKTDKDKLFACYSLIEQMRLEHNKVSHATRNRLILEPVPKDPKELEAKRKQGFIRPWCPEGFMLADTLENNSLRAKFRSYAHESKAKLKKLLAEQNRLRESIRWTNYTHAEWKAVSKLSENEQIAIFKTLFGDKNQEKVKTTKATSSVLDELKALNLDDMPEVLGSDPTEDFSTYDETDEGSDVTKTADRITFTAAQSRSDTFHVSDDKDAGHFDGDFEHLITVQLGSLVNTGLCANWMLANIVGDYYDIVAASEDGLNSNWYYDGSKYYMRLAEIDGGGVTQDLWDSAATSTVYYLEIERDDDAGTFGETYIRIYTVDYGDTLQDTLTVVLNSSKKDFRYVYGLAGYDTNNADAFATGYVELLDLQEAVGWTNISHVKGVAAASISHKKGVVVASISHVKGVAV